MELKINVIQIIKCYLLKYFFKIFFLFLLKCSVFVSMVEAKIIYDFSKVDDLDGWYVVDDGVMGGRSKGCLLYTSPSPRDGLLSRMPSSA